MATRSKKPKCDGKTSQSCGMGCISREHTCRELIAADVATRLLSVAKQHQQPNDASGQSFDAVAANFPASVLKAAHKTGVATSDLGNGAVLTTKEAVGLDGSSIKYGFVTDADGKRYTVSDGLVKEVTSAVGSEWGEAFEAAVRSKVAIDKASDNAQTFVPSSPAPIASVSTASAPEQLSLSRALLLEGDPDKALILKSKLAKASEKADAITALVGVPPGGEGLAVWIGPDYKKISPIMFAQISSRKDFKPAYVEVAKAAVQALVKLPQPNADEINGLANRLAKKMPPIDDARMASLNRFASMSPALLATYKKDSIVTEQAMFGTTYLNEKEFYAFSKGADTHFIVKSKGFDGTSGKAMDSFKKAAFEGEILFAPGTRFKVADVIEPSLPDELASNMRPAVFAKTIQTAFVSDLARYPADLEYKAENGATIKVSDLRTALLDNSLNFSAVSSVSPDAEDLKAANKTLGIKLSNTFMDHFVSTVGNKITKPYALGALDLMAIDLTKSSAEQKALMSSLDKVEPGLADKVAKLQKEYSDKGYVAGKALAADFGISKHIDKYSTKAYPEISLDTIKEVLALGRTKVMLEEY